VRKSLDMFRDIASRDAPADGIGDGEEYKKFWENFGKYLKVGVIEEPDYKDELAGLVRFWSTKSGDEHVSLDGYASRMQTNQTNIFYVTGDSKKASDATCCFFLPVAQ
jgi:heat shock protein beta